MAKPKTIKSHGSAVQTLKRFFDPSPGVEEVSLPQIYAATGRQNKPEAQNRMWLANKLTTLRYYDLVEGVYSYDGRRKLEKVKLTRQGKDELAKSAMGVSQPTLLDKRPKSHGGEVSLADAMEVVSALRKQNPEYQVVFTVKLKEEN